MTNSNELSLTDILNKALELCLGLPKSCTATGDVESCKKKLTGFTCRIGITGMAGRGVSTLINTLTDSHIVPNHGQQAAAPVILGHGTTTRCVVRYKDQLAGVAVQGSNASIADCLAGYLVPDSGNKILRDAIVSCDAPLLSGGIEIADIPGFSAQADNSTSLDFMSTCDCLLYVLSGSQKLSDREAAFIMEAAQNVSSVYFLVGKTDLLTVDDMKKSDTELSNILTALLHKKEPVLLFHFSAKMGQELQGVPFNNPAWQVSGIGVIKTDIIETQTYEKYCKVARDVQDNLRVAITALHSQLYDLLSDHGAPIERIRTECAYLEQRSIYIDATRKKCMQRIESCYAGISAALDNHVKQEQPALSAACIDALKTALKNIPHKRKTLPAAVAAAVAPSCARLIFEVYDRIMLDMHARFRKTYEDISTEIAALASEIAHTIPGAGIDLRSLVPPYRSLADTSRCLDDGGGALCSVVLPSAGLFANIDKKQQRAIACFSAILDGCIKRNMVTLPVHIKEATRLACDKLYADSMLAYESLLSTAKSLTDERLERRASVETTIQPQVAAIKARIDGCETLATSL